MSELYKTLEFKEIDQLKEKYAHPVKFTNTGYTWGNSSMPLLMTVDTSIEELRLIYPDLDFNQVRLVLKKLSDISTNSA